MPLGSMMPLTYHEVTVVKVREGNYTVNLDGQELQSANSVVNFPNETCANEVAKELRQVKDNRSFSNLPMTKRALAAYDRVTPNRNRIDDIVLNIALTDVICYRAMNQPDLSIIEKEKWDPLIKWIDQEFALKFSVAIGVVPILQPKSTISKLKNLIQKYNDLEITAISELAVNTCSLIVTLAMIKRKISVSEASSLVFLEESHQIHRSTEEININKHQDAVQQELREALEFFFLVSK
mgnify:CR=1 FL=1